MYQSGGILNFKEKTMSKRGGSGNGTQGGAQGSGASKGSSSGAKSSGRPGAGAGKGPGDAGGWPSTTGKISGGNRSNSEPK